MRKPSTFSPKFWTKVLCSDSVALGHNSKSLSTASIVCSVAVAPQGCRDRRATEPFPTRGLANPVLVGILLVCLFSKSATDNPGLAHCSGARTARMVSMGASFLKYTFCIFLPLIKLSSSMTSSGLCLFEQEINLDSMQPYASRWVTEGDPDSGHGLRITSNHFKHIQTCFLNSNSFLNLLTPLLMPRQCPGVKLPARGDQCFIRFHSATSNSGLDSQHPWRWLLGLVVARLVQSPSECWLELQLPSFQSFVSYRFIMAVTLTPMFHFFRVQYQNPWCRRVNFQVLILWGSVLHDARCANLPDGWWSMAGGPCFTRI